MPKFAEAASDRKLCIICSKGTLDMAYPGLVLANSALAEGIEVDMFFTFWGLDMVHKDKADHLKFTPVGNTSSGMPQFVGGLPGMTTIATKMMKKEIAKLDFPEIHDFLTLIHDSGARLWACQMSMDMMHLAESDLIDEVKDVIGAGEFMEMSEGAQIIFI